LRPTFLVVGTCSCLIGAILGEKAAYSMALMMTIGRGARIMITGSMLRMWVMLCGGVTPADVICPLRITAAAGRLDIPAGVAPAWNDAIRLDGIEAE
jgi:hypothetical protein